MKTNETWAKPLYNYYHKVYPVDTDTLAKIIDRFGDTLYTHAVLTLALKYERVRSLFEETPSFLQFARMLTDERCETTEVIAHKEKSLSEVLALLDK